MLGFLLNRKVLREDECQSNYSDFKLLGFDKHLLMQVLATEFFIAVFSTSRNVIALQHKARMIHMPCSLPFHTTSCIRCAQKHPVMMVPPSPLLRLHSPKKTGSLLHSPLNYSICKAQITKYIFSSKSFTYLQKNRTA